MRMAARRASTYAEAGRRHRAAGNQLISWAEMARRARRHAESQAARMAAK